MFLFRLGQNMPLRDVDYLDYFQKAREGALWVHCLANPSMGCTYAGSFLHAVCSKLGGRVSNMGPIY